MIPRKLFQTWETKPLSDEFKTLPQSWIDHNPTYEYILFDKDDRYNFIKENFDASVLNAYCKIVPGAYKADLWRYCVLYIHGGVYADIDTICKCSIDDFLNETIKFITVVDITNQVGYNLFNSFIATIPKHPIMLDCIKRIVYNVEHKIIKNSLDFSGPGVLGKATNIFLGMKETSSFVNKEGIHGSVKLLKFNKNGNIGDGTILFQNKNGNGRIKQIYIREASKIKDYVNFGKCKKIIM